MCTAGQRVSLTITGPGSSFFLYSPFIRFYLFWFTFFTYSYTFNEFYSYFFISDFLYFYSYIALFYAESVCGDFQATAKNTLAISGSEILCLCSRKSAGIMAETLITVPKEMKQNLKVGLLLTTSKQIEPHPQGPQGSSPLGPQASASQALRPPP